MKKKLDVELVEVEKAEKKAIEALSEAEPLLEAAKEALEKVN